MLARGTIVLVALTILLFAAGCYYFTRPDHGPFRDVTTIRPDRISTSDSVLLTVDLYDTLFRLSDLRGEMLDTIKDSPVVIPTHVSLPGIKLNILNKTGNTILLPDTPFALCQWSPPLVPCDGTVGLFIGKLAEEPDSSDVITWREDHHPMINMRFRKLDPGDTFTNSPTMFPFLFWNADADTGTWWLQIVLENTLWIDTLPPVWVGRVASDTAWFRVIQ